VLFVHLQTPGETFAITGPWHKGWLSGSAGFRRDAAVAEIPRGADRNLFARDVSASQ